MRLFFDLDRLLTDFCSAWRFAWKCRHARLPHVQQQRFANGTRVVSLRCARHSIHSDQGPARMPDVQLSRFRHMPQLRRHGQSASEVHTMSLWQTLKVLAGLAKLEIEN